MATKAWTKLSKREREKNLDTLKTIKEKSGSNVPGSMVTLVEMVEMLLKTTEVQDEKMGKVEKELSALQEVRGEVAKLRDQVAEWGKRFDEIDSKLNVLSELDANIKDIQKEHNENMKSLGEAVASMNSERELMKEERVKSEEAREAKERAEVAPCLIVMGLEKGGPETYKQLEDKVVGLFQDGLGLNPSNGADLDFIKVERFGPGGRGTAAAAAAAPERPPLVRITLMNPSMKSVVFSNVANLRGKEQYSRVSIQNEVPSGLMTDYKKAVERAKQLRADTNVKTRVSFAKGPVVVLIKMAGWKDFVPEDKLNDKQTEELENAKRKR